MFHAQRDQANHLSHHVGDRGRHCFGVYRCSEAVADTDRASFPHRNDASASKTDRDHDTNTY